MNVPRVGRILLVDDEEVFLGLADELFSSEGFAVDTASDGDVAIAKMEVDGYGTALVDLHMPGKNGLDVAQEFARMKPEMPVSVLAVPSHIPAFQASAEKLGVRISNWFEKPIPVQEEKRRRFFNYVEFDIYRFTLGELGEEAARSDLERVMSDCQLDPGQVMEFIRPYRRVGARTLDGVRRLRDAAAGVNEVLAVFEAPEERLARFIVVREEIREISEALKDQGVDHLRAALSLISSAMQTVRAEDLSEEQVRVIAGVLESVASPEFDEAEMDRVDRQLYEAGLDFIPVLRKEEPAGNG